MPVTSEARARLINLFSFFKAVEQRRNKLVLNINDHPWKLPWAELPTHPKLRIQTPADGNEFTFALSRQDISACPPPPDSIKDWLVPGWEKPEKSAEHLSTTTIIDHAGSLV